MLKLVAKGIGSGMQGEKKKKMRLRVEFCRALKIWMKAFIGYGKRNEFAGKRYKDLYTELH